MIDTDVLSLSYVGNGSVVTGYPITFPFLGNTSYIKCGVTLSPADEVILAGGQYTVHQVGSDYFVRTATAYSSSYTVRVYREIPLTQPLDLVASGPLNPEVVEMGLDRQMMVSQQIALSGAGASIPAEALTDVMPIADAAARATTAARRTGQLAVQLDTGIVWRSLSTTAGDWSQVTGGTVPLGGTGLATLTAYALLAGGTTATGALQQVSGLGTLGQVLGSNGAAALPTWKTIAAGGDVVGPASAFNNTIPMFSGTTGKLLKGWMGVNDGTSAFIGLGEITDTTPRALTVFQVWDNVALAGRCLTLAVEANNAAMGSTFLNLDDDGTNMGKWMLTGEIRALDGGPAYPVYSFEDEPGTGMYRDTGSGGIRHAVGTNVVMEMLAARVNPMVPLTVTIGSVDKFYVTSTFVKTTVDFLPQLDGATDIGTAALRFKDIHFSGGIKGNGTIGNAGATAFLGATLTLSGAITAVGITSAGNFTGSGDYIFSSRTRIKSGSDGLLSLRNNADTADANLTCGLHSTSAAAPTIASAGTIAPVKAITFISGVAAISTITPPSPISAGGGQITLIPTGIFTTDTAGNIALASTAVVGKALIMTYDVTTTKWYPSY